MAYSPNVALSTAIDAGHVMNMFTRARPNARDFLGLFIHLFLFISFQIVCLVFTISRDKYMHNRCHFSVCLCRVPEDIMNRELRQDRMQSTPD